MMKIRNGFVSNSSSSSFCIIISKKEEDEWLESMNIYQKKMMKEIMDDTWSTFSRRSREIEGTIIVSYFGDWDTLFEDVSEPELIDEDKKLTEDELCEKYEIDGFDGHSLMSDALDNI